MKIAKRIKLHNVAFVGNTNLQMDLDTEKRSGLRLIDDEENHMVYIQYKGDYQKMPYTNVAGIVLEDQRELAALFEETFKNQAKAAKTTSGAGANTKIKAQASSPQDHVFAGLGGGQTGVGGKSK